MGSFSEGCTGKSKEERLEERLAAVTREITAVNAALDNFDEDAAADESEAQEAQDAKGSLQTSGCRRQGWSRGSQTLRRSRDSCRRPWSGSLMLLVAKRTVLSHNTAQGSNWYCRKMTPS